jgi:hypothetical protein
MDDVSPQLGGSGWVEPRVTDLGGLTELTQSVDLFFGPSQSGLNDLSFSGVTPSGTVDSGATVPSAQDTSSSGPGPGPSGGGGPGGGAGGASGPGPAHGELPFTGYSLGAVAAVGSMLSAAGVAIRRSLGRSDRSS